MTRHLYWELSRESYCYRQTDFLESFTKSGLSLYIYLYISSLFSLSLSHTLSLTLTLSLSLSLVRSVPSDRFELWTTQSATSSQSISTGLLNSLSISRAGIGLRKKERKKERSQKVQAGSL
jgi:hypothetical protein